VSNIRRRSVRAPRWPLALAARGRLNHSETPFPPPEERNSGHCSAAGQSWSRRRSARCSGSSRSRRSPPGCALSRWSIAASCGADRPTRERTRKPRPQARTAASGPAPRPGPRLPADGGFQPLRWPLPAAGSCLSPARPRSARSQDGLTRPGPRPRSGHQSPPRARAAAAGRHPRHDRDATADPGRPAPRDPRRFDRRVPPAIPAPPRPGRLVPVECEIQCDPVRLPPGRAGAARLPVLLADAGSERMSPWRQYTGGCGSRS
jgi:hypothetical protein